MNLELVNNIINFILYNRQLGSTSALCQLAKDNDAIVVCAHSKQSNDISKAFNIKTVSLFNLNSIRGIRNSIFIDNYAIQTLLSEIAPHLEELHFLKKTDIGSLNEINKKLNRTNKILEQSLGRNMVINIYVKKALSFAIFVISILSLIILGLLTYLCSL